MEIYHKELEIISINYHLNIFWYHSLLKFALPEYLLTILLYKAIKFLEVPFER